MFEEVRDLLKDFTDYPESDIRPETLLISDLGMNSLIMIEAVVAAEERFGVEIPDRKLFELRTVADVCGMIEELGGK